MRRLRQATGRAFSLVATLQILAGSALASDAFEAPAYFKRIQSLSESNTSSSGEPSVPCTGGWKTRDAGPDFTEAGCRGFGLPDDFPHESKSVQLNLMARGAAVFAVGVSHQVATWTEAEELAERVRADLPRSFSCLSVNRVLRCTSGPFSVVVGAAQDVPAKPPTMSILYVRDLPAFQAFYAAQIPASPAE